MREEKGGEEGESDSKQQEEVNVKIQKGNWKTRE